MKALSVIIITFCIVANSYGQTSLFPKEQALKDIDSVLTIISETHPDMYAIVSEETFTREVKKVKGAIPDSLSAVDFYKQVAPLVTMLGDGHTSLWFPESLINSQSKDFFPWAVRINPETFSISTKDGDIDIVSINGQSSQVMIGNMIRYSSGELIPFRVEKISLFFPVLMKALYPAEEYRISIIKDGFTTDTIVQGISVNEVEGVLSVVNDDITMTYSYYFVRDKETAVMTFDSFENVDKMKLFLDSMFLDIEKSGINNLIIDIRGNGGGDSRVGDELFQYISPVPFCQFGKTIIRISRLARKEYPFIYRDKPDGYEIRDDQGLIPLRENPLRNNGKLNIFLLTSPQTFSSASDFAWAFQYFKMGRVIGQETGGSIVSFGDSLTKVLETWGISLTMSYKKFYVYGVAEDVVRGVIPDITVSVDEALDYTLNNLIIY